MPKALITYCHDHLAGARFAVSLLKDLASQDIDRQTAELAKELEAAISHDQCLLEGLVDGLGADTAVFKEAAAWVAQKASRAKLTMSEPFGIFEAVEMLSIGVLGKRALWYALTELKQSKEFTCELDLEGLILRAEEQFEKLESLRRRLARTALRAE